MKTINDLIALRIKSKITINDIAKHLGISSRAYTNKEKGRNDFKYKEVVKAFDYIYSVAPHCLCGNKLKSSHEMFCEECL